MAVRGIVFDFGGVISKVQDVTFFPAMEALTGWGRDVILAGWKQHRRLMDADLISVEEVYVRIAQDRGEILSEEVVAQVRKLDFDSWAVANPETLTWAQTLKAEGFKIGILTNMPTDFIPWFERCAGAFRRLADAELISGEVHLVKPQAEIYRLMAARMGMAGRDLFFMDDAQENVDGAVACGWQGHCFRTVAGAKLALAKACEGNDWPVAS